MKKSSNFAKFKIVITIIITAIVLKEREFPFFKGWLSTILGFVFMLDGIYNKIKCIIGYVINILNLHEFFKGGKFGNENASLDTMGVFNHLVLLFWKYYYYRKFYFITTVMEIVLPIILTYIVIKISTQVLPEDVDLYEPATLTNRTNMTFPAYIKYKFVGYTPKDDIAASLFNRISRHYFIYWRPVFIGFDNEDLLIQNVTNINTSVGVIIDSYWPTFKYRIRDNNAWNTTELYVEAESEQSGPYVADPYFETGFAALQSAIDMAFFDTLVSFKNISYSYYRRNYMKYGHPQLESYFQAFPYPAYMKISAIQARVPLIIGLVVIISSLILTGPLVVAIISEKESGLKEWMKISGLSESTLWLSWFINSMIVSVIVYTIVTFELQLQFYGQKKAIFSHVDSTLIWSCIILYFTAQISFSFLFCAVFNSTAIATLSLALTTIVTALISLKLRDWRNRILLYFVCFCPSGAIIQIFIRISYFEILGLNLYWSNIFNRERNTVEVPMGHAVAFLLFDTVIYLFLTYFISNINPGRFGYKKPWYFLFKSETPKVAKDAKKIKRIRGRRKDIEMEEETAKRYIEEGPPGVDPILEITNLQKKFGYVQVVRNLNLSLYRGQILVLLGHNGAGKTTALSMLTGLTTATDGVIIYKDHIDVLRDMKDFRRSLGTCPQDNRAFPYMSVVNHLKFFGGLKGGSEQNQIHEEAMNYLKLMDMTEKADELPTKLSTATRRKLSLLISLMGKSEVLILDEPTVGVDDFSKLRIWSLLKNLKEKRTIIITSHVMKEAAEIGDRIAVLNNGGIACSGSLEFLKGKFGSGYQLRIIRKRDPEAYAKGLKNPAHKLIDIITNGISGAKIENRTPSELSFHLPLGDTSRFASLFKSLESQKKSLNIDRISLSYSSLDQIFLKVGGQYVNDPRGRTIKGGFDFDEPLDLKHDREKVTHLKLLILRFGTLLKKKYLFMARNRFTFIFRIILPTILMLFLVRGIEKFALVQPPLQLTLEMYDATSVLIHNDNGGNSHFQSIFERQILDAELNVQHFQTDNIVNALLLYAHDGITSYRRDYIFACNLNLELPYDVNKPQFVLSLYNKWVRHSFPVLINTFSNALIKYYYNDDSTLKIIAINHPIQNINTTTFQSENENDFAVTVWFTLLGFFTVDLFDYFIIPTKIERIDGFKHIQLLSGISGTLYWVSTFIYDFILFTLIIVLRVLVFKIFDTYDFFTLQPHMGVIITLILLAIIGGLVFTYVISFIQKSKHGSYIFFFLFNLACSAATYVFYQLDVESESRTLLSFDFLFFSTLRIVIWFIPPLNFLLALIKVLNTWKDNYESISNSDYIKKSYFSGHNDVTIEVAFLIIDIILYTTLLILFEQGIINKLLNTRAVGIDMLLRKDEKSEDIPEDVANEHLRVNSPRIVTEDGVTLNRFVAKDLRKIYLRVLSEPIVAMKNATFAIDGGECFVLLGREGAGKTTTIRMISGELIPTRGDAMFNKLKLSKNRKGYLSSFGFCPDVDCLLEDLTGKEMMAIVAAFRGIDPTDREPIIEKWLSTLDLETVQNKPCSTYSGGNKRKLCSAMALLGDPEVILMDEPQHGVDPISRKKLNYVLAQLKLHGQIILFTTHSMDECEDLCDRLTILVRGEMRFVGTIDELRKQFARGFSLTLKLQPQSQDEIDDSRAVKVELLKKKVLNSFKNSELKLETKNMLYFLLKVKMLWSEAFVKAENIKQTEKLIMEYLLTETSLDEVYLSFYDYEEVD